MAAILTSDDRKYFPWFSEDGDASCSLCCSDDVVAYWFDGRLISVCHECASRVLPMLIADATVAHLKSRKRLQWYRDIEPAIDRYRLHLYRALAIALSKVADQSEPRQQCGPLTGSEQEGEG